jgi:hypothetical protein
VQADNSGLVGMDMDDMDEEMRLAIEMSLAESVGCHLYPFSFTE